MSDSERDAVLAANLAFYHAFTTRDGAAMDRLWARSAPVTCIHPGWAPLAGRARVMESWRAILANPEAPHVARHDDAPFLHGNVAIVLCEEEVSGGRLAASNVFAKEAGQWRLVHHQAGPLVVEETRPASRPRTRH